jgi:putative endonuclease
MYVISNNSMTLYTGVTNNLRSRVEAHKSGDGSEFTSRYHFDRLVYFETFDLITAAIAREKQIKGMTRAKKIALIKALNPTWRDLSDELWPRQPESP